MVKVKLLSGWTETTTGIGAPGLKFFVKSLNWVQKSGIFKPLGPKAVPTGGAGVAFPAPIVMPKDRTTLFGALFGTDIS